VIEKIAGVPGGLRIDVDGRLYVAAKGVAIYTPDGRLQRTLLEGERATNCAFGESDLESLFIGSRGNIYRVKLGVKGALQY
jgi:gluconolactonase